ncbi:MULTISPECIES: hypothetical protein [Streptomyces]|uniref:Head fiber protein n=1 Tax=Streptomyces scopuliridis RB72 TaxID=1440053 RepID=A0A2T7SP50_9ACTN|nr:hypothetical protein [Streptomyces scopuliridis]PVE04670.1 hypothetical protein Y717_10770 [Streptomyces scopuliridis RB72]
MAGVQKQITLVKGGTRKDGQEVSDMRVVGTAPALMDGTTKPTVNNIAAAPTQADFNALLAALRTRGVIGGS